MRERELRGKQCAGNGDGSGVGSREFQSPRRTQSGGEGRLGIRRGFVQDVALSRGCREDAIIT